MSKVERLLRATLPSSISSQRTAALGRHRCRGEAAWSVRRGEFSCRICSWSGEIGSQTSAVEGKQAIPHWPTWCHRLQWCRRTITFSSPTPLVVPGSRETPPEMTNPLGPDRAAEARCVPRAFRVRRHSGRAPRPACRRGPRACRTRDWLLSELANENAGDPVRAADLTSTIILSPRCPVIHRVIARVRV